MGSDDWELDKLIRDHGKRYSITREAGRLVAVSRDDGTRLEGPSAAVVGMFIANHDFPDLPRAGGASGG